MGFLCRQGRIKMEVVVGLLIVIGAMLEGSEGFQCYMGVKGIQITKTTCGNDEDGKEINGCITATGVKSGSVVKSCAGSHLDEDFKKFNECIKKVFGRCAINPSEAEDQKVLECVMSSRSSQANPDYAADYAKLNAQLQSRQGKEDSTMCFCYSNLCNGDDNGGKGNPAGRSAPNAQVILGVLVAASLYAFNTGLGYL